MKHTSKSPHLVHWTGRDLDAYARESRLDKSSLREAYLSRLVSTLSSGLWMMPSRETIAGANALYVYEIPMTCFTEILLSRIQSHTLGYGRLGFGFPRMYVLVNLGSPVMYIRQHPLDPIVQRVNGIFRRIDTAQSFVLPTEQEGAYWASRELDEIKDLLEQICAFVKPMSNEYGEDDFTYIEEVEWRVAFSDQWYRIIKTPNLRWILPQRSMDILQETWEKPPNVIESGKETPPFYLKFEPDDLSVLILPDEEVRRLAWQNEEFRKWIERRSKPLPLLTVEECVSF